MKIGIVGAGQVGATAAYSMMMRRVGSGILLVDRNADLAVAQARDILDATPFADPVRVSAGELADLHGARLVVLAAGTNQRPGESRLDLLSRNVAEGAHAVLLLDRAGWHTTSKLDVPGNITPIFLPSRAPELNPVENVWQYLRQNWLSNTVFENYDAIVDAACAAWQKLIAQPETITSIGMRDWAHVGQPL